MVELTPPQKTWSQQDREELTDYPQHIKVSAISLAYQGLDPQDICTRLDLPESASSLVLEWNKDSDLVALAMQTGQLDLLRDQVKSKLLRNANIMIDMAIEPSKLKKATSLQLMTSVGIALQKIIELENKGQSTQNMQQFNININRTEDAINVLDQEEAEIIREMQSLKATLSSTTRISEEGKDMLDAIFT